MKPTDHLPIPFAPINRHGVIGDRRTGALIAADSTLDWFCVPDFDGAPIFGSLLEPLGGGFCRFGPSLAALGRQHYLPETAAVVTGWRGKTQGDALVVTVAGKVMSWLVLKRTEEIARRTGCGEKEELARWRTTAETIHADVMAKGWNESRNSFVQRYGSEVLDAAALVIPLMAGELGLFAEEADPRRHAFSGNTPLLFAHIEYVRAAAEVARARGVSRQKF
jgi:GH15 family glucan-1,4-alpha-glucosidase